MSALKIYTDGACWPNPGNGGWAWINEDGDQRSGAVRQTTNNQMEITAVIMAMQAHRGHPLLIFTDSKYVINGLTVWFNGWIKNGWKTRRGTDVLNKDLWLVAMEEMQVTPCRFQWVKGHNGDPMNEAADRLANDAANSADDH